jgi:hypothetical protein
MSMVAQAEELVATKVLSMGDRRLQDRIDAIKLLEINPGLDLDRVRADLRLIEERGFHRHQDLAAKLARCSRPCSGAEERLPVQDARHAGRDDGPSNARHGASTNGLGDIDPRCGASTHGQVAFTPRRAPTSRR